MKKIRTFVYEHKWILLIVCALFLERLYGGYTLGIDYNLGNDDLSYVNSGIEFAKTGVITMHGGLSAQIMPGMPILIGAVSFLFGEGKAMWFVLKILWWLMGSLTAFFVYKSITIFVPRACGILASLAFFATDFVWMDNLILTETPFMLCFSIMIYATLMMVYNKKYFWICALSYMLALMFKANIAVYPLFAMCYLLVKKYDVKVFVKQCFILASMVLCFIIPWSIRNYIHYDAFIPLTYGSGNPMLLGTYQGHGYPTDEELDYEKNVDEVAAREYKKYYNENGEFREEHLRSYVLLEKDGVKAKYRLKEWVKKDPLSMIDSYLIQKPISMIDDVFYWETLWEVPCEILRSIRKIDAVFCMFTIFLAFYFKKYRKEIFFLTGLYMGNIYIYAMTFAFDRYAQTLMPVRFIIVGMGCYLVLWLMKDLLGLNNASIQIERKEI